MAYDIATAANQIIEDLGYPDAKTELLPASAQRHVTEALTQFNKRVGKWTLRTFQHTADTQTYDTATIFPTISCRRILSVFNGDSVLEKVESGVTNKYLVMSDTTNSVSELVAGIGSDITTIKNFALSKKLEQYDFDFIEPTTLILLPPPGKDCLINCIVQENYGISELTDDYYILVRSYAQAKCQEVVGNARGRLNSVARTSEIARYTNREKYMYDRADIYDERFKAECDNIIIGRMKLIAVR